MIDRGYYLERKTASVDDAPPWMLADAHAQRHSVPDGTMYQNQADLYRRLSWVQIAVSAVAQTAAGTAFSVKRHGPASVTGRESLVDIPNHPFELRLARPNPLDSRYELLEATVAYRLLTGNAYWWLNRPSPDVPPTEIWPIPPYQIQPVPDGNSYLSGYAFSPWGFWGTAWTTSPPVPLELHEVVHFKSFNPNSRFVGLSPIEALATIASADLKAQQYNANFFGDDNAKVPGALAFADMVNDSDWEKIQHDFKHEHGGSKRKMMLLRGAGQRGVSWVQMGLTQQEMQFLDSRQFTKEEIFALLAPGLASSLDVNATEANASAGKASFIELGVWPLLSAMAEKISNDVLPAYGDDLKGMFDDIRPTNRELDLAEQSTAERVLTIDEIRQKYYGLAPLARRGDALVAEIGPGSATPESTPDMADTPEDAPDDMPEGATEDAPDDMPEGATEDDAAPTKADAPLTPDEQALFDALQSVLATHGERTIAAILSGEPVAFDALTAALLATIRPALTTLLMDGLDALADTLGLVGDAGTLTTNAGAWANTYSYSLVRGLDATTRTAAQGAISAFMNTPGMTRGELETLLRPAFGPRRAEAIAITEVSRAAAEATNQTQTALREAGIEMERVWRTNNDERVCPVCGPLNGQAEGEWAERLPSGPPAHPRCRCSITLQLRNE